MQQFNFSHICSQSQELSLISSIFVNLNTRRRRGGLRSFQIFPYESARPSGSPGLFQGHVAAARKRSHQWYLTLTPNNTETIERMTCHCFLRSVRRELTSSSYTTVILLLSGPLSFHFFLAIFGQGDYDRGGYYCNLQNPSRKPNRKIVVHKSFKYISNFKTCLTNLPVLITNICLFLDDVVFIDVGKHRQSLIDGLLRGISQVLANQKQREKSKWPIRVFRRNSGRNFGKERKEGT